jgi:hypothetical protein
MILHKERFDDANTDGDTANFDGNYTFMHGLRALIV